MTNVWNQTHNHRGLNYHRLWYSPALSLLNSLDAAPMKIFEIGCGCGEFGSLVEQRNSQYQYIGLDGHFRSAQIASQAGHRIALAEFEQALPLPMACADIVISLEVVEHIANAEFFLKELNRILKPGGYLILSTPNVGHFLFRLKYLFRAEVAGEGVHLRFFNRPLLRSLVTKAGFRFVRQRSFTPIIGYNRIMRVLFNRRPQFVKVPEEVEGVAALHFVWLLRKETA